MAVDTNETGTTETDDRAPVTITLEVPGRVARDYERLARAGVYLSLEEALRATLVTGWRYDRGSFLSVRVDGAKDESEAPNAGAERGGSDTPDAAEQA